MAYYIIIIYFTLLTHADSSPIKFDSKWMECELSNQCLIVPSYCGGYALINKKYETEYTKYLSQILKIIFCDNFIESQMLIPENSTVTCIDNKCILVKTKDKKVESSIKQAPAPSKSNHSPGGHFKTHWPWPVKTRHRQDNVLDQCGLILCSRISDQSLSGPHPGAAIKPLIKA